MRPFYYGCRTWRCEQGGGGPGVGVILHLAPLDSHGLIEGEQVRPVAASPERNRLPPLMAPLGEVKSRLSEIVSHVHDHHERVTVTGLRLGRAEQHLARSRPFSPVTSGYDPLLSYS